jgi:hypothetical protein
MFLNKLIQLTICLWPMLGIKFCKLHHTSTNRTGEILYFTYAVFCYILAAQYIDQLEIENILLTD